MASKILLADDSITIQKVVNLTFADEGIDVVTVSNGEMAERRLSEINPDLVLADIFMPGKNGYELCQFIKDTPPFQNIPVVLLVGAFEPFDQSEARRVRADGHLTKPFESRTLVETVRKLIQTSRSKAVSAKQNSAKLPQPVRETRPLSPDPEQRQDAFIGASQIVSDGSEHAAQNGGSLTGQPQESPASDNMSGADPLGVDYHGLWEMGTGAGQESHSGVPSEVSFGIDLGNGDALGNSAHDANPLFSSGFEVTTPEAPHQQTEPAAGGFEFGFPEPSRDEPPSAPVVESGPAPIAFSPGNRGAEQATGFAVPSLFSDNAKEQVLDFKQVEAPEPPVSASGVSFELNSPPIESTESAPDLSPSTGADGKFFDLMPAEATPDVPPQTEAKRWAHLPEAPSAETAPTTESGFDFTPVAAPPDPGPSVIEEEPLGDVFSEEKAAGASIEETSFAIAEEALTVDVGPPAGDSFRMVLPPAQESGYSGSWPQLDSDQSPGPLTSLKDTESMGSVISRAAIETPLAADFSSESSSERSFAIAETGPVVSPFDPMELRADEPTEASTEPPVQTSRPQEPSEQFTSSLMWSEDRHPAAAGAETVPVDQSLGHAFAPVLEPAAHAVEAGPINEWVSASEPVLEPAAEPAMVSSTAPAESREAPDQSGVTSLSSSVSLPSAAIDEIVRRVVMEISDTVVRELAWEILPDCVERVVEKLSREALAKKL